MVHSYSKVMVHLIFATYDRLPMLTDDVEKDLYSYLAGILRNLECPPVCINGHREHVHVLFLLSRTKTIAQVVEEIKTGSSKWMKTKGNHLIKFAWQEGYGTFSVSQSKEKTVIRYIQNQKEHHKKISFREEFLRFLEEYEISIHEKDLPEF